MWTGSRLPCLGPATLWKTFFAHIRLFPNLVSTHTFPDTIPVVDPDSFAKFVMSAYGTAFPRQKNFIDYESLERTFASINAAGEARLKGKQLKVPDVRQLAASLTWSFTYWISGASKSVAYLNGFESTFTGPVYGFVRTDSSVNEYGHYNVQWSDDADAATLRDLHKSQLEAVNNWDLPAKLDGLKN